MKKQTTYECEICGQTFNTEASALNCENRGRGTAYPKGLLHSDADPDGFYGPKLAFAIAKCRVVGHGNDTQLWACRDNGSGDSLGKQLCGDGNTYRPTEFDPRWLQLAPFKRLVAWLRASDVVPLVWINGQAVSLDCAPERKSENTDPNTPNNSQANGLKSDRTRLTPTEQGDAFSKRLKAEIAGPIGAIAGGKNGLSENADTSDNAPERISDCKSLDSRPTTRAEGVGR